MKYPGRIISGIRPVANTSIASGIWNTQDQMQGMFGSTWPGSILSNDPYFSSVLLLLHMDGSNGSTTFTDNSSYNRAITAGGSAQVSTSTFKFGSGSVNFGATNGNYLSLNSEMNIPAGNYTIEFWAYLTGASASGYSIAFGAVTTNVQIPYFYSDGTIGYYNNGASGSTAAGKMLFNQWVHVAMVRSSNVVKIYINGTDSGVSISDSGSVYIKNISGYNGGTGNYNILGYFDDVRITSGVARYTSNFTAPSAAFPNA